MKMSPHHKVPEGIVLPSYMFIHGERIEVGELGTTAVLDPGSGVAMTEMPTGGASEVLRAVESSATALDLGWASMHPTGRAEILFKAGQLVRDNADRLAMIETLDVGKPLSASLRSVLRTAEYFTFYAGAVDKTGGQSIPLGPDKVCFTERVPIGVTGHIIPWNVPISTVARGLAPALACGNTAVIKPAEEASMTSVLLAELLIDAGVPPGVVNVVTGPGRVVGQALAEHPDVGHLTFTGSVETGKRVMVAAASHVASVTLELGGKSPQIVLSDADLDHAAADVARNVFSNAGQICSGGTRLLVERSVHKTMVDRLVDIASNMTVGHGLDEPNMGPIISERQRASVAGFVDRARDRGIHFPTGGEAPRVDGFDEGFYYRPTIADDVEASDELAQVEIFGPVLTVIPVDDVDHAIEVANGTEFGLAAGVHTKDISKALRIAREVSAGQVYVNGYHSAGDTVPFGGMKQSGLGREKGLLGLDAYSEIKAITITL